MRTGRWTGSRRKLQRVDVLGGLRTWPTAWSVLCDRGHATADGCVCGLQLSLGLRSQTSSRPGRVQSTVDVGDPPRCQTPGRRRRSNLHESVDASAGGQRPEAKGKKQRGITPGI